MKFLVKEMALIPRLPEIWGSELTQLINDHIDYLKKLQDEGKLVYYAFVGRPGGIGIWDVETGEELDTILMDAPRFKYCTYEVTPVLSLEEAKRTGEYIHEKAEEMK
jgi:muconolactone delta-isomerase